MKKLDAGKLAEKIADHFFGGCNFIYVNQSDDGETSEGDGYEMERDEEVKWIEEQIRNCMK